MANDYSGLIWPTQHMSSALNRATSGTIDSNLSALYRKIFDQSERKIEAINVPAPFARTIHSEARFQFITTECEQLPLSIVTVTRNDNHVEQMHERTQAFIDSIYFLAEKYGTNVELIVVEWNPPPDRPSMKEAFNFLNNHPYVSCSIISVGSELHAQYRHADNLPLYQMIGKNVGIRRARGKFILATNIDVLLSEQLFTAITSASLETGKLYRSNRWDIDRSILTIKNPKEQLLACPKKVLKINYASGPSQYNKSEPPSLDHRISWFPDLHTWACGDFQLMHRQDWAKVGGYSELDAYSYHIDSLFALTCYHAGISEHRFDNSHPHFHIDHTLGVQVNASEYTINENKTLKHLSLGDLLNIHLLMDREKDYFLFNHDDWGLATEDLPQIIATTASWQPTGNEAKFTQSQRGSGSVALLKDIHIDFQEVSKQWVKRIVSQSVEYLKKHHLGKAYFLWGTGQRASAFGELLGLQGVEINAYIGYLKEGDPVMPSHVISPEVALSSNTAISEDSLILVTSMYADEIIQTLKEAGKREGKDYIILY